MSDTIKKRVGLGTAYGFAKAGGYEGTVEQFTELLGNIAIDLARIENLSVTVTTLPAGSQATASLNGSVLSLGIPKGDKGDKGNTGNTPDFDIGTVTTLSAGSSATASITGTAENPVLNLGIPEGQAGSGAVGTVASAYSASKTYAVGDYAIHNSNLYRCTTAINTAEAFTAAHWTQVVLGDDVSDLKSALSDITGVNICPSKSGQYYLASNGTIAIDYPEPNSNWLSALIPCSNGDTFLVTSGGNGVNILAWAFVDSSGNILSYESDNGQITKKAITAPQDTSYLVVNCHKDYTYSVSNKTMLADDVSAMDELLTGVAEKVIIDNNRYDSNSADIETGGIYLSSGAWYANASYFETGYIPTNGNGETLYFTATNTCHVNWYNSSKTRINGATSAQENASLQKITIESANAAYIRIGLPLADKATAYVGTSPTHIVTESYKIKESALPDDIEGNHWQGKKWYAFGTSITDGTSINAETGEVVGKYVPYLAELSGMTAVNKGVAGGTFDNQIKSMVLATDVSDADLITIEGCVNDFAVGTPIGEYGDYAVGSIYGDMYAMAKYCCENSNALVVFITDSTGKLYTSTQTGVASDLRFFYKKGNGLTQGDYNEAIKKCSAYMGLPCIDAGGESSIDFFHPQYIADQIHHTELGGEQYAKTIWNRLKNLKPLTLSQ